MLYEKDLDVVLQEIMFRWDIPGLAVGIVEGDEIVYAKGFGRPEVKRALSLFAAQLFLNILWSIVFFGAHRILGAVIVIVGLWVMILRTILLFGKISRPAAYLLVPYILWVSFAAVLNVSVYVLNR